MLTTALLCGLPSMALCGPELGEGGNPMAFNALALEVTHTISTRLSCKLQTHHDSRGGNKDLTFQSTPGEG